jgi:hypothetical protein
MGYSERNMFVGKDVDGNEICAGFRFQVDVPQGAQLTLAQLKLWIERLYPASQAAYDSFRDEGTPDLTAHIADLGPVYGWEQLGAYGCYTNGNVARTYDTANHYCYNVLDVGSADGTVLGYMDNGGAGQRGSGLVFRASDDDNYWVLWGWANEEYPTITTYLQKCVGGSLSTVDSYNGDNVTANRWFKIVLDGSSIKCYVDDVLKFDITDSDLVNNTKHGVFMRQTSTSSAGWVDDFEFLPPGTPSPNIEVACHDVDNAPDFNAGDLPGARTLTTAKVSLGDISGWTEGDWNDTVDIKDAIQEILDRPGWSADNYLAVILKPTDACGNGELVRIHSYEQQSSPATELFLTW